MYNNDVIWSDRITVNFYYIFSVLLVVGNGYGVGRKLARLTGRDKTSPKFCSQDRAPYEAALFYAYNLCNAFIAVEL